MSVEEALVRDEAAGPAADRERDQVSTYVWWPGRTDYESFELERLSDVSEALSKRTEPDGVFWVDLFDPKDGDDSLLLQLGDELGFSRETIRLAADDGSRPKAARHATHTFITTYATDLDMTGDRGPMESRVVTSRISAFLLERGLVTVRHDGRFEREQLVERWSADRHLHDWVRRTALRAVRSPRR